MVSLRRLVSQDLNSPTPLALLVTASMAATVGAALAFEHIGGYIPCALCLVQRMPYYLAVPLGVVAAIGSRSGTSAAIPRTLLALIGLIMLVSAGLGVFHAGVEWGFWEGPASCGGSASVTTNAGDLLTQLNTIRGPSCTEASLRVLGLSFAGWNVIASLFIAALAFKGAKKA